MKIYRLTLTGVATALVAGAAFIPSAAFASSTVTYSQPTVCPGESARIIINGVNDGSIVNFTAPEYYRSYYGTDPSGVSLSNEGVTWELTWASLDALNVDVVTSEVVTTPDLPNDPNAVITVVSSATLQVLSECAAPAPEPEAAAETLPNTGAPESTMTALALGASFLGLGGAVLARRARRLTSHK